MIRIGSRPANLAGIILFVPADRIEQVFAIYRAAIMQRFPPDDVMRDFGDELPCQGIECFRIPIMREPITLQGTGDSCQIGCFLSVDQSLV